MFINAVESWHIFLLRSFGLRQSLISFYLLGFLWCYIQLSSPNWLGCSWQWWPHLGQCTAGEWLELGCQIGWMGCLSPGKQANLLRQALYSSKTVGLVSWPLSYFPGGGMVLTSSKFADIIRRSWECQKPSMDGLPGNPWCWIWYCPTCPLRRPLR